MIIYFLLSALQNRFRRFFDIDRDGKATHKEVANYLMKYDPAISKPAVDAFVASRDLNSKFTHTRTEKHTHRHVCVHAYLYARVYVYIL